MLALSGTRGVTTGTTDPILYSRYCTPPLFAARLQYRAGAAIRVSFVPAVDQKSYCI